MCSLNSDRRSSGNGETLLEVTIAVSVLMIILSYTATLFTSALKTLGLSREKMVAMFLAEEGIEGTINIIGSNLLRLSSDIDNCWNAGWTMDTGKYLAIPTPDLCTNPSKKIGNPSLVGPQYFRLLFDSSNDAGRSLFRLEPQSAELKLKNSGCTPGITPPCLDPSGSDAQSYRLFLSNSRYVHETPSGSANPTLLYRSITIEYFDDTGSLPAESNAMMVISKVTWFQGNKLNSLERSRIISKDHVF